MHFVVGNRGYREVQKDFAAGKLLNTAKFGVPSHVKPFEDGVWARKGPSDEAALKDGDDDYEALKVCFVVVGLLVNFEGVIVVFTRLILTSLFISGALTLAALLEGMTTEAAVCTALRTPSTAHWTRRRLLGVL